MNNKMENQKIYKYITLGTGIILMCLALFFGKFIYTYSGVLYTAAYVIIIMIIAAIAYFIFRKNELAGLIVSLVFLIFFIALTVFTNNIDKKVSKVKAGTEYTVVQIAVLKNSTYTEESDFSTCKMGYVNSEEGIFKECTEILEEHNKTLYYSTPFEDSNTVYEKLCNNEVQLIALTSRMRADLNESNPDYEENLKVIFEKKFPVKGAKVKAVDISKEPFTVYLQGVDRTADGDINSTGSGDVNILLSVNPKKKLVNMQVIPRDTLIKIDGVGGRSKLTYAGAWGGVQSSIASLEEEYGIDINYYAKINFQGLEDLVDALGGVEVYSHYSFSSGDYSYNEGYNYVNGNQALMFARVRKILPGNELARGVHQQELIKGILNKFSQNPSYDALMSILDTVSDNFVSNLPQKDYAKALQLLARIMPELQKMEAKSVKGEFIWQTDEVDKRSYLYYFVPMDGEKERIKKEINSVVKK